MVDLCKLKTTIPVYDQNRTETEIDRDCRVIEHENLLISNGFEYVDTRMSQNGGVRLYLNKSTSKFVEVMRNDAKEMRWWIGNKLRELGHGKSIDVLKRKI